MPSELIVGVTGGIAAFKTAALVSSLVQQGHGVTVVMTRAARKFVGPATFRALTGRPVASDVFDRDRFPLGAHIELAEQADLMVVAPASADFLAKAACGLADDLLEHACLELRRPAAGRAGDEHRDVGEAGGPAQRRHASQATASISSTRKKAGKAAAAPAWAAWPSPPTFKPRSNDC